MTDIKPEDTIPDAEPMTGMAAADDPVRTDPVDQARPVPARGSRGGAFLGLVLGGVIAAGLGFAAARLVPQGWPLAVPATDAATALDARFVALEAQVQAFATRAPAAAAPDPRLDGLAAELADLKVAMADRPAPVATPDPALRQRLDTLDQRLAGIEQAPATPGGGIAPATFAALQAEVRALREGGGTPAAAQAVVAEVQAAAQAVEARLADAEQRATALAAETGAATRAAARTAAFARLRTAIDTGLPFDAALADLASAGVDVPALLTDAATAGVPAVTDLQDSFPAAARAALEASRQADMGTTFGQRVGSFLMNQTRARSLEPRAGPDPDAVLSRAEAALKDGDLPGTLAELAGLPPEGQAAVADWTLQARGLIAVREAVATLAAQAGN